MVNLELHIARSLSLPRRIRSGMLDSLRANPRKALRYGVLVDDLSDAMIKAYQIGHRSKGATLRRESRTAKLAEYKRRAREVLRQYQVSSNAELKRIYQNAKASGKTDRQIVRAVVARFNSLGFTPPASNRLKTLYNSALRSAFNQGLFDAARTDPAVWGFRYIAQNDDRVRPTHKQYDGVTLPRSDEFWNKVWPPIEWNCRCRVKVYKRKQKIVKPPPRPIPIDSRFKGQDFALE